jgi:hypothetical protein
MTQEKQEIRDLATQQGWDEAHLRILAEEFIADSGQTSRFLEYLKDIAQDERI